MARYIRHACRLGSGEPLTVSVRHRVERGETLGAIWARFKAPPHTALQAERAIKEAGLAGYPLRFGDYIELQLARDGKIVGMRQELSNGRSILLDSSRTSGYVASLLTARTTEVVRKASGIIESSLVDSARKAGVPYAVVDEMVDLFGSKVEFRRDLQPGDTFSVVFSESVTADGRVIGAPVIQGAALNNSGRFLAAVAYSSEDGIRRYYDADGNQLGNYFLRYPLKFSRISSVFSKSRFHPVLGVHRPHNGVDFAAPTGTEVRSVGDGVIESAGYNKSGGKMVRIRHGDRYSTAYLHLSRIAPGISKGRTVARGQVIGAVGMTGYATGPHLHFSLYDRGRYVDPLHTELPTSGPQIKVPAVVLAEMVGGLRAQQDSLVASADRVQAAG